MRATPHRVGSRCHESVPPSTSTTAWPGHCRKRSQQVAALRAATLARICRVEGGYARPDLAALRAATLPGSGSPLCQGCRVGAFEFAPALVAVKVVRPVGRCTLT